MLSLDNMISNNIDSKIVKPFTWLNVSFDGNEKLFLCVKQFLAKILQTEGNFKVNAGMNG